jgi:splicing factor U2AF subunit
MLCFGSSDLCTQDELKKFLNSALVSSGAAVTDGPAISHVRINQDKSFAFVELRSVEEATNATALNGIRFKGSVLKVNRSQIDKVMFKGFCQR